jgi:hypothetical protein
LGVFWSDRAGRRLARCAAESLAGLGGLVIQDPEGTGKTTVRRTERGEELLSKLWDWLDANTAIPGGY